jgi:hypothetical protein
VHQWNLNLIIEVKSQIPSTFTLSKILKQGGIISMRGKKLEQKWNKLCGFLLMVIAISITFEGCNFLRKPFMPKLNDLVNEYDDSMLKAEEDLLLQNIIRLHYGQPPHFTAASSISANFTVLRKGSFNPIWRWPIPQTVENISSPQVTNEFGLTFEGSFQNNPTITIAPITGQEFANRLAKPIETTVACAFLGQAGKHIDKVLRLLGQRFEMKEIRNRNTDIDIFDLLDTDHYHSTRTPGIREEFKEKMIAYKTNHQPDSNSNESNIKCYNFPLTPDHPEANNPPCNEPQVLEGMTTEAVIEEGLQNVDIESPYGRFRQLVLHIKAAQLCHQLQFCVQYYDKPVDGIYRTAEALNAKDTLDTIEKNYRWEKEELGNGLGEELGLDREKGFILYNQATGDEVGGTFRSADKLTTAEMKDINSELKAPEESLTTRTRTITITQNQAKIKKTTNKVEKETPNFTDITTKKLTKPPEVAIDKRNNATIGDKTTVTTEITEETKEHQIEPIPETTITKETIGPTREAGIVTTTTDTLLNKGHFWKQTSDYGKPFILKKRYPVIFLTNFDFENTLSLLGEENKKALLMKIFNDLELNDLYKADKSVLIVLFKQRRERIRYKNLWEIYGYFTLRNFMHVLQFLAESFPESENDVKYEREYCVAPNILTVKLLNDYNSDVNNNENLKVEHRELDNPRMTLEISQSTSGKIPGEQGVGCKFNGKYFYIAPLKPPTNPLSQDFQNLYPPKWNMEVFKILYELFQENSVAPAVSPPVQTIGVGGK